MDARTALRGDPSSTALFLDFDGTLSPIVAEAADARPLSGVPELLVELQRSFGLVAIVSGRPVSFLRAQLPSSLELHGLYGLEQQVDGVLSHHPEMRAWTAVVAEVAAAARASGPAGVEVEDKGASLTLHFRRRASEADDALAWATDAAAQSGLIVRPAKMSLELHPPIAVDKGTVVEARSAGMSAAGYLGDDSGDLPAFAALDRLAERGLATVKVAVHTEESSAALLAQADLQVDGPEEALAFLRSLLDPG